MSEAIAPPEPSLLAVIARELATEQFTPAQILERYQISQDFFDRQIAANGFFRKVLADYTKEWQAPLSTQRRLAAAATMALEEKMPVLAARMGDRASALADAVATAKLFKDLAGIAPPIATAANAGERFSINISFGQHRVALDATPVVEMDDTPALEAPNAEPAKDRSV